MILALRATDPSPPATMLVPPNPAPFVRRTVRRVALAAAVNGAVVGAPMPAAAQMPGLALLQNGFVRPGAAVAANYGTGDAANVLGVAAAWTPGAGRFQLSAGVGAYQVDGIDGRKTSGGLRVALPVRTPWTRDPASALGVAGFIGVGGASLDAGTLVQVPIGVGVGYRRALGADRAVSVFATPFYQFTRVSGREDVEGEAPES